MNNFDLNQNAVDELVKWLRQPKLYNIVVFDFLIILMIIKWSQGYLTYIGFIVLILYVNMCFNNPMKMPKIMKQYLGIE